MDYDSKELVLEIARWGEERGANEIVIQEIFKVSHITDYFVIMHARNRILTAAITEYIRDEVEAKYHLPLPHIEGQQQADWLLMDYGAVVVHVFLEETRRLFDLEHLWLDAPLLPRPAS
ncbi:MAG: ribosome silencing factor [Symbiobacteriaceae bacterium]|nr:ribosome silencing factor [Symbiobacteriaceae bacterium]